MTATEELRRLLTEAGVEWDADDEIMDDGSISQVTYWYSNDIEWSADGRDEYLAFDAVQLITPEQAISATLRQAVRHPKPHEKWTTVLLPEIAWSWDDSWPDYLSVAHDTHGEWRTYVPEATLGAGTCEADETDTWECVRDDLGGYGKPLTVHVMECTECGHVYEHVNGDYEFCPRCGRKRKDVSE